MLYPEIASTVLPVLRAHNVEESLEEFLVNAGVVDFKELSPRGDMGTSQATQEGRLQLHRQFCGVQGFVLWAGGGGEGGEGGITFPS